MSDYNKKTKHVGLQRVSGITNNITSERGNHIWVKYSLTYKNMCNSRITVNTFMESTLKISFTQGNLA